MAESSDSRRTVGARGEKIAADHLRSRGYRILEQNVRLSRGELDIVARDGDVLAFVEVRARRGTEYGSPEESITERKKARLRLLVDLYLQSRQLAESAVRIDVVLIDMAIDGSPTRIEVIKNAVGG